MKNKGSVLVHVLMTGVVVAIVSAGILRLARLRYLSAQRAATSAQNRKQDEGVLNRAITSWNQNGLCSTILGSPTLSCSGVAVGNCGCSCSGGGISVTTSGSASSCKIVITSQDPLPATGP